jgi:hypothetical protein
VRIIRWGLDGDEVFVGKALRHGCRNDVRLLSRLGVGNPNCTENNNEN